MLSSTHAEPEKRALIVIDINLEFLYVVPLIEVVDITKRFKVEYSKNIKSEWGRLFGTWASGLNRESV